MGHTSCVLRNYVIPNITVPTYCVYIYLLNKRYFCTNEYNEDNDEYINEAYNKRHDRHEDADLYIECNPPISITQLMLTDYTTIAAILKEFIKNLESVNRDKKKSKAAEYQDEVIKILNMHKNKELSDDELKVLQEKIEDITMYYDSIKRIEQMSPDLVKLLIQPDKISAIDYVKSFDDIYGQDLSDLNNFEPYSLECLIIYTLASVFNPLEEVPAVRVSTLVELLQRNVKNHAKLQRERNIKYHIPNSNVSCYDVEDRKKKRNYKEAYAIGIKLVEYLNNINFR